MTTFTRILLNPASRGGRKLLTNPQALHAAVCASLPPDTEGRILWRHDQHGHQHTLYIVSPEDVDRRVLVDQAGWPSRPGDSMDYGGALSNVREGQVWRFRLTANPVRSVSLPGRRGKVRPILVPEQQVQWLVDRSAAAGFEIPTDPTGERDVTVTRSEELRFRRGKDRDRAVDLRRVQFDGLLRVTDEGALRRTLTEGIGKGRAYGCGLLTLAKIGG